MIQNSKLDEEKSQWKYISEFERDGTVSNQMEKFVLN